MDATVFHVVSSGWLGAGQNGVSRVVTKLLKHGIHVHVVRLPFQAGLKLGLDDERLHCYAPITSHGRYIDFLRQFDFGITIHAPLIYGELTTWCHRDMLRYNMSARIVDYCQAGLPCIIPKGLEAQVSYARRYAPGCVILDQEFLQDPHVALARCVRMPQPEFPRALYRDRLLGLYGRPDDD
jgi:hypothetical protein